MPQFVLLSLLLAGSVQAAGPLTAAQAKGAVGKEATVCGVVASASYIAKGKGAPTLINLDEAYPKQIFTIVIYGKDREKFGKPEADFAKKELCVTGKIEDYKGKPQIVVSDPKQIQVKAKKAEKPPKK